MEHRLDTRLLQLPPASLHALTPKLCAIDEFKGWWSRARQAAGATENAGQVAQDALAALGRIAAFGAEDERAQAQQLRRGLVSASRTGYAETLEAVLADHVRMEFGEELLLSLHSRLLAYVPESRANLGRYRTPAESPVAAERNKVDAARFAPMVARLAPGETKAATEWARTRLRSCGFHPLLVIGSFTFELLCIRPFARGNERLVRVVTQLLLLRCGYEQVRSVSLDAVFAGRWNDCQGALRRSQANRKLLRPDISPWLGVCLDVLLEHGAKARAVAERAPDESRLSANQLGVLQLFERDHEVTNRAIRESLGLPRDTAKQVIKRLVTLGRIEAFGAGRSVRYRRSERR